MKTKQLIQNLFLLYLFPLTIFAQGSLTFNHTSVTNVCAQGKALGDMNGDGYPDIVIAEGEFTPRTFAWFKYPSWEKYDINTTAFASLDYVPNAQVADMDGDGDMDIIIPNSHNSQNKSLWWFENPLNEGGNPETDGFAWHVVWSAEDTHIKDVEVTDFDQDGKPDIVIRHTSKIALFYQNSADSWTQKTWAIGGSEGMGVGDLDWDGDTDIIANGQWFKNPGNRIDSWVTKSIGSYSQGNDCRVQSADINGDGKTEPVFSNSESAGYAVSWYSTADPDNGPWTEHVIGYIDYCHTLQTGDVDRDGDIDVVGGSMPAASTDEVVLFENTGAGSTWTRHTVDTKSTYIAKITDMGLDGDLDIVGSRSYNVAPIDFYENQLNPILPLNKWHYILADNSRSVQVFGLGLGDVTGDGFEDIASGPYFYRNPGGDMTDTWTRVGLPNSVDAVLITDVDDDAYGDIIAQKEVDNILRFYWLESMDNPGSSWTQAKEIGSVTKASHTIGSQGHRLVQIETGGKPEIVVSSGNGLYYFSIPASPASAVWPVVHINGNPTDEGFGAGDIDGDGDLDLAAGTGDTKRVEWYKNPGNGTSEWAAYHIGDMPDAVWTDRFEIADLNGDNKPDILGTEENGATSGAENYWWEQPADPESGSWTRHLIVSQATTNSMDVADMDEDGDVDVILAEHRGTKKLAIWENDGSGNLTENIIDTGKESHLGGRVSDLDNDGDLDVVSIAWDTYSDLHIWRNDAIQNGVQTVATPVINPDGGTFSDVVTVSLSTNTSGASIYYTLNGNNPDETSTLYSNPFSVDQTLTVKAKAYKTGMNSSGIASALFTIEQDETPPTISSVSSSGNPNFVRIVFNENMDQITTETSTNYSIDQGISVISASLDTDQKTVVLFTSDLSGGVTYTLTVNNVEDVNENPIASNTQKTFQFSTVQLNSDLIACYHLDEINGTTVHDGSGNGNDGVLQSGAWSEGYIDGAAGFNGSSDYISLSTLDISGSALTIACWFYADDFDNEDARLVSKAIGIQEADHYWMLSTTSTAGQYRLRFRLKTNGSTTTLIASSGALAAQTWYHAAAVYDGTNMKLYLNGSEVGSVSKAGTISINASVSAWIGCNPPTAGSNSFDGRIDEVRIYNRALTQNEISALYSCPVQIGITVYLEGPFQSGTGQMDTALNTSAYLPLTSPYSESPRSITKMPASVVDWVLVQLRESLEGAAVVSKSVLLRNDGKIVADDGITEDIPFNVPDGYYYVVVKHQNHLSIMSAEAMQLK